MFIAVFVVSEDRPRVLQIKGELRVRLQTLAAALMFPALFLAGCGAAAPPKPHAQTKPVTAGAKPPGDTGTKGAKGTIWLLCSPTTGLGVANTEILRSTNGGRSWTGFEAKRFGASSLAAASASTAYVTANGRPLDHQRRGGDAD